MGCLNVTKLPIEVWLLFKLQSSGDSPGPQKIILRKYIEVTLLEKQGSVFRAAAQISNPRRRERSRDPAALVGVGQRLRPGSRGVRSGFMGDFTALTSLALLTGLFPKQLLISKGCSVLHRVFRCGTQQSPFRAGAGSRWAGKIPRFGPGGSSEGLSTSPGICELQGNSHHRLTFSSPTACFQIGTQSLSFLFSYGALLHASAYK